MKKNKIKVKINKLKFIRNIIIATVALLVVAFILDMTPGFQRDKYKDITNIVIKDENLTEELKNLIYISESGTIYLSAEDAENLLDSKVYLEEAYNEIVVICDTKVASLVLNEKSIEINGSTKEILEPAIQKDGIIYLPVSAMTLVFNIEVNYIKENDVVIIDKMNAGIIKADISTDTSIKYKARKLSKKVGEVKKGEKVSCFYTTSKGWRLIRTENGVLRICKSKYFR